MMDDREELRDILLHEQERTSKTARKKEMIELQKLGERLVQLPESYLRASGLPEKLLEAVLSAKKIKSFGARRRQMQYIGAVMRQVDAASVRDILERYAQGPT